MRPGRRARSVLLTLSTSLLAIAATPVAAQDCLEPVGRWPYGYTVAAAVSGEHLFFGNGSTLMIADLADPAAPRVVGDVGLEFTTPQRFAFAGSYVYVADWEFGLRVIDVADPSTPVEVGFLDTHEAGGVAVTGSFVYTTSGAEGVRVIDVSDPSAPVEVAFLDTRGDSLAVTIEGSHAYVADGDGGLRILDISSPAAPVEVGAVNPPAWSRDVAVKGDYAYVSAGFDGVRVIDVSDPSAPVEVAVVPMPRFASQVVIVGDIAFVADGESGVRVLDLSNPAAPVEVGSADTPGFVHTVAAMGNYAYVPDDVDGIHVVDASTPSGPVEVFLLRSPGWAEGLAVEGDRAYVGFDPSGFRVLDVSDQSAPVELSFVETTGPAFGVAVSGSYAYVAAYTSGLRVIDVRNPSAPVEVGFVDTPGAAYDVAVAGGYAYVADHTGDLRVIDVSNPSAPVEVAHLDVPGVVDDVAVSGRFAYLATGGLGLRIIDVSNPSAPVDVGWIRSTGSSYAVAVSGRYAYLANGTGGLRIIDVSVPSALVEVGAFPAPAGMEALKVAAADGIAYVSWLTQSGYSLFFSAIDFSAPSAPLEVGHVEEGAIVAWTPVVAGGRVFLTGQPFGLSVLGDCAAGPAADPRDSYVPAAAVAAGAQGAFFATDLELNNTGTEDAQVTLQWLPRGQDNPEPVESEPIALTPGQSLRYENVLTELFGLAPDSVGALRMVASTQDVIGMSRTYNIPGAKAAGTFGQGLAAIRATAMIQGTEPRHLIFLSENDDARANVGCVNGTGEPVAISLDLFDPDGTFLETTSMELGPYSNDQINRVFRDYAPINGSVDVRADRDDALYFCYGSMLDNETSDPTTILPLLPSADTIFIPAAALAAGLEGAFFKTDLDLANVGSTDLTYRLLWLPRGEDNSNPITSDSFSLAAGSGVRYANVLDEVFGLSPDEVGAVALEASGTELLAMSRTYNLPPAKLAGTFGQELPGIPADQMIASGVRKRIIFMNENDDVRSNVGCVNGSEETVRVFIELFGSDGQSLETRTMDLAPYSNNQITRVFRNHAPVSAGYVDVWTNTPGTTIYCYGSVLDNLTSDPTTVLPQ